MYVGQMVRYVFANEGVRAAVITRVEDASTGQADLMICPIQHDFGPPQTVSGRWNESDKPAGSWHYIPESEKAVRVDPFRKPKLGDWVVYVDNHGDSSDGRIESLDGETSIRKLVVDKGPVRAVYHVLYQKEGSVRSWHWPEDEDDESNSLWAEDVTIPPRPPQVDEQVVFVDRSGEGHTAMVVQARGDRRIDLRTDLDLSTRKRVRYSLMGRPNSWSYLLNPEAIAAPNVGIAHNVGTISIGLNTDPKPIVDPDGRALESPATAAREWGLAKVAEIIGLTGLWKAKDVFERVKVLVEKEERLTTILEMDRPE